MTPASVNEIAAINVTARFMVDRPANPKRRTAWIEKHDP